jgi:hypothetical protein
MRDDVKFSHEVILPLNQSHFLFVLNFAKHLSEQEAAYHKFRRWSPRVRLFMIKLCVIFVSNGCGRTFYVSDKNNVQVPKITRVICNGLQHKVIFPVLCFRKL